MNTQEHPEPRLPFPTKPLQICGVTVEEYIIPPVMKGRVLKRLYPFRPMPKLRDEFVDIHSDKKFRVHQFRVTRENGHNVLVSPFYEEGGGTVIDWMPADDAQN